MLQKIKIIDEKLDKLDEISNKKFLFEKFKQINSQIETLLVEIKTAEFSKEQNGSSSDHLNLFKDILNKIDKLETKILYKANLFESFSKSNS